MSARSSRPLRRIVFPLACATLVACFAAAAPALALSLREAVATTIDSNPQITQAIENREGIQFELRQARGLYLPRIDFEASAGPRKLEQPGNTSLGNRDIFHQREAGLVGTWKLFDGGNREGEVER